MKEEDKILKLRRDFGALMYSIENAREALDCIERVYKLCKEEGLDKNRLIIPRGPNMPGIEFFIDVNKISPLECANQLKEIADSIWELKGKVLVGKGGVESKNIPLDEEGESN